jgi:ribose 5-phosphate isomerase B
MIAIGADHGGYELKETVKKHLEEMGIEYKDFGTYDTSSVDYPLIAAQVAQAVAAGEYERGILICGTGLGMSIAANKVDGIRAACCSDSFSAEYARRHNDANILCMGGRVIGAGLACSLVDAYFSAEFEGGRHTRRLNEIKEIENK